MRKLIILLAPCVLVAICVWACTNRESRADEVQRPVATTVRPGDEWAPFDPRLRDAAKSCLGEGVTPEQVQAEMLKWLTASISDNMVGFYQGLTDMTCESRAYALVIDGDSDHWPDLLPEICHVNMWNQPHRHRADVLVNGKVIWSIITQRDASGLVATEWTDTKWTRYRPNETLERRSLELGVELPPMVKYFPPHIACGYGWYIHTLVGGDVSKQDTWILRIMKGRTRIGFDIDNFEVKYDGVVNVEIGSGEYQCHRYPCTLACASVNQVYFVDASSDGLPWCRRIDKEQRIQTRNGGITWTLYQRWVWDDFSTGPIPDEIFVLPDMGSRELVPPTFAPAVRVSLSQTPEEEKRMTE